MHTSSSEGDGLGSLALKEGGGRRGRKVWNKVLCWEGSGEILGWVGVS